MRQTEISYPKKYLQALMLCLSFFFSMSLEGGGWGKAPNAYEFEGTAWNEVYFDMNGLSYTASLPNYSGTVMQNGLVTMNGKVSNVANYLITTTFNPGFTPPKNLNEFVKMIQGANPGHVVSAIEAKFLGAKYAVDLVPINPAKDASCWRFLVTKDRLVKMGALDENANRRLHFFESIRIN